MRCRKPEGHFYNLQWQKSTCLLDQNFPSVQPQLLSLDLMGPKGKEWFSAPISLGCTHFTPVTQARGSLVPSSLLSITWASLVATTSEIYLEPKASHFRFTALALASGHIFFIWTSVPASRLVSLFLCQSSSSPAVPNFFWHPRLFSWKSAFPQIGGGRGGGSWFQDDSSALQLLCTLFLI